MVDFERRSQAPQHQSRCGANAMSLHSNHCALGNAVDNLGPIFELRRKVGEFFLYKKDREREGGQGWKTIYMCWKREGEQILGLGLKTDHLSM